MLLSRPVTTALMIGLGALVAGCGMPVRIGINEARAAGVVPPRQAPSPPQAPAVRTASATSASRVAAPIVAAAGPSRGRAQPVTTSPGTTMPASIARTTQPAAVVVAPSLPPAQSPDAIAVLRVDPGATHSISIGLALPPGSLPRGSVLVARVAGHALQSQFDVAARYPDGSIRLAIVTLAAGAAAEITLLRQNG